MNNAKILAKNFTFLSDKKHSILKIDLLINELYIYLLEIIIIKEAIKAFTKKQLKNFDSSVGDWKCQTRTSLFLDLIKDKKLLQSISKEQNNFSRLIKNTQKLILNIKTMKHLERQQLTKELKTKNIESILIENHIFFKSFESINVLSLLYLCSPLNVKHLPLIEKTLISHKKFIKILNSAKYKLTLLTIDYERQIALTYGSKKLQKILNQVESKGFCSMTAFFPSFKPIFQKLKASNQILGIKIIHFCLCTGITNITLNFYSFNKDCFILINKSQMNKNDEVMIIAGYQFSHSFNKLKKALNLTKNATLILDQYQKPCGCNKKLKKLKNISPKNIESVILAGFVQHPQFITNAEIDWKGLGLENSDLKKEYDHLKTIPGCSIDDMSQFCIRHIYPSTIADVLKEQEEMEARLQIEKK